MDYCDCSNTEQQIVFENNNCCCPCTCPEEATDLDSINVFNALGKFIGYSWDYGDSVELAIDIQKTVLAVKQEQLEALSQYLSDKEIELNFINMRGEVVYTFYSPAGLVTNFKLNNSEESLIDRNTYTVTAVLINPYDKSRINLFRKPYKLYVR